MTVNLDRHLISLGLQRDDLPLLEDAMVHQQGGYRVCGTMFLDAHIDLKALGWTIHKRRCENPSHHHRSAQWEWWIE